MKRHSWTQEEKNYIMTHGLDECVAYMEGKASRDAVRRQRLKLCGTDSPKQQRKWTEEEIEYMRTHTNAQVAEKYGRSLNSVQLKCIELGIRRKPEYHRWTESDDAMLMEKGAPAASRELGVSVAGCRSRMAMIRKKGR